MQVRLLRRERPRRVALIDIDSFTSIIRGPVVYFAWIRYLCLGNLTAPGLDEPLNRSAGRTRNIFPALTDEADLLSFITDII